MNNRMDKYLMHLRKYPGCWKCYRQILNHPVLVVLFLLMFIFLWAKWTGTKHSVGTYSVSPGQDTIDYIADNVKVRMKMMNNLVKNNEIREMRMELTNTGGGNIYGGPWGIYFYSLHGVTKGVTNCSLTVKHVNGNLYSISPEQNRFKILAGTRLVCMIPHGATISRSDSMPNWYVAEGFVSKTQPKIIKCTHDETLSFVQPYDRPYTWKRDKYDEYNPYNPAERFQMNDKDHYKTWDKSSVHIIPTPLSINSISGSKLQLNSKWAIIESSKFPDVANYLSEKLHLTIRSLHDQTRNQIIFIFTSDDAYDIEQYMLEVKPDQTVIKITAKHSAGAFYGAQTLLSLLADDKTVPSVVVKDKPRFSYRGLMVDVSRNFQQKESILKVIDTMSKFKLNKLHLHLTDDEGWRIEIPDLPELTQIGSKRCHSGYDTGDCLIPSLGSGPFSTAPGSGFYTKQDFRDILKYAKTRNVQVIPEIDIPGHSMAAVLSMLKRDRRIKAEKSKDISYPLNDDFTEKESVSHWSGNTVNPCLKSSYAFIELVLDNLIEIYKGIQDLSLVHIGGDEIVDGAWENSPSCRELSKDLQLDSKKLTKDFMLKVADLAAKRNLNVAFWEDGVYERGNGPYPLKDFTNKEVYVNPWKTNFERGTGGIANEFADSGYKVILSVATHLYLDHPYEPDPEERGLYWATRYIDSERIFGFQPDDIFANADVEFLNQIPDCKSGVCLKTTRPENVIGMQSCLWSETVRTANQMHEMLFPRLLAMAERAWHKAEWESVTDKTTKEDMMKKDWESFANVLGHNVLPRLEKDGIHYRIPPPGAVYNQMAHKIIVNTLYPNHDVYVSFDGSDVWEMVNGDVIDYQAGTATVFIKSKPRDSKRESRTISVEVL